MYGGCGCLMNIISSVWGDVYAAEAAKLSVAGLVAFPPNPNSSSTLSFSCAFLPLNCPVSLCMFFGFLRTFGALGLASSTTGKDSLVRCSTHWCHRGVPAVDIKSVRIAVDHLLFSEKVFEGALAVKWRQLYSSSTILETDRIRESSMVPLRLLGSPTSRQQCLEKDWHIVYEATLP